MLGALIERRRREPVDQAGELRDRVVGEVWVGDMALLARYDQLNVDAAAAADLDLVADRLDAGRLADERRVEPLAASGEPAEHLGGAVDRGTFLIAGEQQGDRAFRGLIPGI